MIIDELEGNHRNFSSLSRQESSGIPSVSRPSSKRFKNLHSIEGTNCETFLAHASLLNRTLLDTRGR